MSICSYDVYYLFLFSLYCRVKYVSRYWYIFFACHINKTNIIFHNNVIVNWCNIDTIENNICSLIRQYNISIGNSYDDFLFSSENVGFPSYIFGSTFFINSPEKFFALKTLIDYHFLLNSEMLQICDYMLKYQS